MEQVTTGLTYKKCPLTLGQLLDPVVVCNYFSNSCEFSVYLQSTAKYVERAKRDVEHLERLEATQVRQLERTRDELSTTRERVLELSTLNSSTVDYSKSRKALDRAERKRAIDEQRNEIQAQIKELERKAKALEDC